MLSGRREGEGGPPAPELPPRYTSPRLLATGGMGTVWCAEDGVLGRRVAIKLLGEAFVDDEHAVRRFMREARAAARLSGHAHVITIFDIGEAAGRPYIVMEHLAGGTVADALRHGAYSRAQALRWLDQAAAALDHAHERGVIHRDVKPANMLLGSDRGLRLADFGIASLGSEQTLSSTGELFGTAAYISPEQAVGESATAASDRYSLAVAAFELVTGARPFAGDTFAAQARAHIEDPPPSACARTPELPDAVDAVLARGMAKSPDERWPSAHSFAAGLRAAIDGEEQARADDDAAIPAPRRRPTAVRRPSPVWAKPARPKPARLKPVQRVIAGDPDAPSLVIFDSIASAGGRRLRTPALAVGVIAAAALVAGALVGIGTSGSGDSTHLLAADAAIAHTATLQKPAGARTSSTVAATQTGTTTDVRSAGEAAELEARGHSLMDAGSYSAALPVLREAVDTAPTGTLTYAYALYDLGRTLRLDGDPQAAIPILEQRLQIPNQPGAVEQELVLARQAVAQQTGTSTTGTGTTTGTTGTGTGTGTTGTGTTATGPTPTAPGEATPGPAGTSTSPAPPAPTGGAVPGTHGPDGGAPLPAGPGAHGHGHAYGRGHAGRAPTADAVLLPDFE